MRNWLKNVLGGGPPQTPDVPEAWIEGLRGILAPLRKWKGKALPAGLEDRVIDYVVRGEPRSVLGELQSPDVEQAMSSDYTRDRSDAIDTVYGKSEEVPAEVGLRWALVLEAVSKGQRYNYSNLIFPGAVNWPELLLIAGTGNSPRVWSSNGSQRLRYRAFERLFAVAGIEPEAMIVAAFGTPAHVGYDTSERLQLVTKLLDYPEALDRHLEKIRPHLLTAMATQRVHVLEMLNAALPETLVKVAAELAELAVSTSKQVRSSAEVVLKRSGDAVIAPLQEFAQRGKPEQRQCALRLLHDLAVTKSDASLRTFARETAQADKAESVRALVSEWDSTQAAAAVDTPYEYTVPTIDWSSAMAPEVPALLADLWRNLNATIDASNRRSREHHERMLAQGHKYPLHQMPELPDAKLQMLKAMLADGKAPAPKYGSDTPNWHIAQEIPKFVANGKLPPTAVYKILAGLNLIEGYNNNLNQATTGSFDALYASRGGFTLLEVSKMFEDGGVSPALLLLSYCSQYSSIAHEWRNEDVWPFFAHHVADLERLLLSGPVGYWFERSLVYRAISTLPTPPTRIVNALFNVALGTGKSERLAAQAALAAQPDKEARIINALSDGKSEVRMAAAQWLGRLKHQPAIPALSKAVMDEKHDTAKGAMLDALEILGEPVEKFLKRDALATEAKKVLAKGMPEGCRVVSLERPARGALGRHPGTGAGRRVALDAGAGGTTEVGGAKRRPAQILRDVRAGRTRAIRADDPRLLAASGRRADSAEEARHVRMPARNRCSIPCSASAVLQRRSAARQVGGRARRPSIYPACCAHPPAPPSRARGCSRSRRPAPPSAPAAPVRTLSKGVVRHARRPGQGADRDAGVDRSSERHPGHARHRQPVPHQEHPGRSHTPGRGAGRAPGLDHGRARRPHHSDRRVRRGWRARAVLR